MSIKMVNKTEISDKYIDEFTSILTVDKIRQFNSICKQSKIISINYKNI